MQKVFQETSKRLNIYTDKITNNKSVKAKIIGQKDGVKIYYKLLILLPNLLRTKN